MNQIDLTCSLIGWQLGNYFSENCFNKDNKDNKKSSDSEYNTKFKEDLLNNVPENMRSALRDTPNNIVMN